MLANPEIDVIDITAPNALHKEMALEAIAAGKHVYCEKPLAPLAADVAEMADAAEAAGIKTQVGFNYICNPMLALAREMIAAGELGKIRGDRGLHAEDYMVDTDGPYTFRHDPAGGGALADLGSHALATAEFLLGPIAKVMGDCVTTISERPDGKGGRRPIEVDDVGRAFLRFENGASGSIEGNWIATGRKMQHDFEVYGSKGALCFSQERFTNSTIMRPAEEDSAGSGPRRITRPMAISVWLQAIRSGLMTSRQSKLLIMSARLPDKAQNHFDS
jgi:predicted dehydrogenase